MRFSAISTVAAALSLSGPVSALPNPSPGTAIATAQSASSLHRLANFYLVWFDIGLGLSPTEWDAWGQYGACYEVPGIFQWLSGSIKTVARTPRCWVFAEADCKGSSKVVQGAAGVPIWTGDSESFKCDAPGTT